MAPHRDGVAGRGRAGAGLLDDPALAAVLAALPRARLVGGCVRDTLAGKPVVDIDLATPDEPDVVLAAVRAAGLRGVPTGIAHGTITAVSFGRGFEVTTLRRDVSTDGRHAVVAYTGDWREDAARRDFTINAMSMERDGTLHDWFGGMTDLAAGRLRFVGDPATRVAEDRLRVLRYFRFFARYAALKPDAATRAALSAAIPDLALLSAERVAGEIRRILMAPDPRAALALMDEFGVLAAVLPEAGAPARLDRQIEAGAPVDPMLRLSGLITGDPRPLAARLRLSGAEAERLAGLWAGPVPAEADDDDTLRRLLADIPPELLIGRVWRAGGPAGLRARLAEMPVPHFPLGGKDALALGHVPGADLGAALQATRRWWLQGGCRADRAACLARLALGSEAAR